MRGGLYREPLKKSGVTCLLPEEAEQNWIMAAIMGDLQLSAVPENTVTRLRNIAVSLAENGAEAVILGCTDLPVAISEETSPVPVLDSTKIHVKAIVDYVLDKT
jgi:aspartate racemase